MDRTTYLAEVETAYQLEYWGEAIFTTLAEHATDRDEIEIWRTLVRLESITRRRLMPLLQRHGIDTTPDPEQWRRGQERGKARAAMGFTATVKSMTESLPPFLTLYARLEAEGPLEDRDELRFLNAHEIALYEFATLAVAGKGSAALQPIKAFLSAS